LAALCCSIIPQKFALQCSVAKQQQKKGNGNIAAILFCAFLRYRKKKKKKATLATLSSLSLLHCNATPQELQRGAAL